MAVGYNNVDVNAANKYGVAVGNTPVSYPFPSPI
jgi:hydroxypyruvate reductase 1